MDFSTVKKKAQERELLFYDTTLENVEIVAKHVIAIDGKKFRLDDEVYDAVRELVGLPKMFSRHLVKTVGDRSDIKMMNTLSRALASRSQMGVTFTFSKETGNLVDAGTRNSRISMKGYLDIVERIMNEHPNLDLHDASYGLGSVNLISKVHREAIVPGLDNENFIPGLAMNYEKGKILVGPYMYRLVCQNGMIAPEISEEFVMENLSSDSVFEFFRSLGVCAANDFVISDIVERIQEASKVNASLYEVNRAVNLIQGSTDDQVNVEGWIPRGQIALDYHDVGVDISELSVAQQRVSPTPLKVWDVANAMTNFASHDHGVNVGQHQRNRLQSHAGVLLTKDSYDANRIVPFPTQYLN